MKFPQIFCLRELHWLNRTEAIYHITFKLFYMNYNVGMEKEKRVEQQAWQYRDTKYTTWDKKKM